MHQTKYSLILTVVNKGYSDDAMNAAREAGAKGGTIVNARGTGTADIERIFGITIEPEKEIILIISDVAHKQDIMKAIYKEAGLATGGNGFSITLPVEEILGKAFINHGNEE